MFLFHFVFLLRIFSLLLSPGTREGLPSALFLVAQWEGGEGPASPGALHLEGPVLGLILPLPVLKFLISE